MANYCPFKDGGVQCVPHSCALGDKLTDKCLIAEALEKIINPIKSSIDPNPNFIPPATRIRSDIH